MFFALIAMFMLPDFPHNSKRGFTEEELKVAQLRMLEDVGEIDQDSKDEKWHTGFIMAVTVREGGWKWYFALELWLTDFQDWKIYILMGSLTTCVTGLSFNMSVKVLWSLLSCL